MINHTQFIFTSLSPENKSFINNQSTSSLVIATYDNKLIVGYNSWRKQWEFPAGKREVFDYDSYDTARREFFEETHQISECLSLIGVIKILTPNQDTRYRAIFLDYLTVLTPFIQQPMDEMTQLALIQPAELSSLAMDSGDLAIYRQIEKEGLMNVNNPRR